MEDSAYEAIYTGVYVFVFIIAMSAALFLFFSISNFADVAFDYGNKVGDSSLKVNAPTNKYKILSSDEVISYYYNYVQKDLYGTTTTGVTSTTNKPKEDDNYIVNIYNSTIVSPGSLLGKDLTYKELKDELGSDSKYVLIFENQSENTDATGTKIKITIRKATTDEISAQF